MRHEQINISIGKMHVVETSEKLDCTVLFLHGWPQDWSEWEKVVKLSRNDFHSISVDLPGIGESVMQNAPTAKSEIAKAINELVDAMGIERFVLVGHDAGGQVVFSYLTQFADRLEAAVIMDVVVPGISPWEKVLINPYIWHFKFHAVPKLPEVMVTGREKPYFDYFFDAITANPASISEQARQGYVKAYSTPSALSTGFGLYRSFDQDAKENKTFTSLGKKIDTPILYLRGDHESGNINEYVAGFAEAGFTNVSSATIKNCGHFAPEEQPEAVWSLISEFIDKYHKKA